MAYMVILVFKTAFYYSNIKISNYLVEAYDLHRKKNYIDND